MDVQRPVRWRQALDISGVGSSLLLCRLATAVAWLALLHSLFRFTGGGSWPGSGGMVG
jgi:hypothetical protein